MVIHLVIKCQDKPQASTLSRIVTNQDDISTYEHHLKYFKQIKLFPKQSILSFLLWCFRGHVFYFTSVFSGWAFVSKAFQLYGYLPFCIISCIAIKFTSLDYWLAKQIYGRNYRYKDNGLRLVYQELPSAKNHKDEFICIFCGNKRFFRKGIYASDSCTVNCTKCQHYLYTE